MDILGEVQVSSLHQSALQPEDQIPIIIINIPHCLYKIVPLGLWHPQMALFQDSKSHTAGNHSSRHHWLWSIFCSEELLELSTSLESCHHGKSSISHPPDLLTSQSQQPLREVKHKMSQFHYYNNYEYLTLHMLSSETRIFLAARSLWMKPFPERYCMPSVTCWEKLSNIFGRFVFGSSPGLLYALYKSYPI